MTRSAFGWKGCAVGVGALPPLPRYKGGAANGARGDNNPTLGSDLRARGVENGFLCQRGILKLAGCLSSWSDCHTHRNVAGFSFCGPLWPCGSHCLALYLPSCLIGRQHCRVCFKRTPQLGSPGFIRRRQDATGFQQIKRARHLPPRDLPAHRPMPVISGHGECLLSPPSCASTVLPIPFRREPPFRNQMDLSGRWASLGRPPPDGAAMRRAYAATECHSENLASHQLLKVENISGATWLCTVAPACPPAPGRTCTYLMRGELAEAATMPRAVSDATEVPSRLANCQWAPRLAFTSVVDGATPQVSDWPHS